MQALPAHCLAREHKPDDVHMNNISTLVVTPVLQSYNGTNRGTAVWCHLSPTVDQNVIENRNLPLNVMQAPQNTVYAKTGTRHVGPNVVGDVEV